MIEINENLKIGFIITIPKDQLETKVKELYELNFKQTENKIELENEYFILFEYEGKEDYKTASDILTNNNFKVEYNNENHIL